MHENTKPLSLRRSERFAYFRLEYLKQRRKAEGRVLVRKDLPRGLVVKTMQYV